MMTEAVQTFVRSAHATLLAVLATAKPSILKSPKVEPA
jgi:hypothetical protein